MQLQLHYITQHCTTLINIHYTTTTTTTTLHCATLHYTTTTTTLLYTTLDYTTLYHTTVHNTTVHYTTLRYLHHTTTTTATATATTLHQLHYIHYNSTTLPYNYNYNCTTPHYIQQLWWGDHCNHCNHSKKHKSNHVSVHQWIRSAIHESQQLTSPIVSYLWNFRHRLVRYWCTKGLFSCCLNAGQWWVCLFVLSHKKS